MLRCPKRQKRQYLAPFDKLGAKFVAVRSSATSEDSASAAWAGQLDTFLNTAKDKLLENVKKCWASLFTPRAIFYRFEKKLRETPISVAVVIQKMVDSEESGIGFSVHPVTQDRNQLIIEAGFGLGEAIVAGQITPDSYVVDKQDWHIIDINVNEQSKGLFKAKDGGNEWKELGKEGKKQVLNENEIIELSKLIVKIENHYGFPVDIEWAKNKGKFHITQSRPITTLNNKQVKYGKQDSKNYKPDDYLRMFSADSFPFIFSDIFLQHYKDHGVLSLQNEKYWISFFPKASKIKTLKEGAKLYTNKKLFDKYNKEFHNYIEESSKYFEKILAKENINAREVKKFLDLSAKHFSYYSKTEFFYTDAIDQNKMVITIQQFDKLKLDGRTYLNKILFVGDGYIKSLIKKLSEQTKIPESELFRYWIDEIVELLKTDKKVNSEEIKRRNLFFNSRDKTLFGDESKDLVEYFFLKYMEMSDIIRGTIANKGIAKGKARVLAVDFKNFEKISQEVEKMEKGEILIAETTSPEIIQACKKASAIVTNQGGMLSHAAIISRELNIPCVIGTDKNVLLNIKTGDLIEVNADEGIVKILKKV